MQYSRRWDERVQNLVDGRICYAKYCVLTFVDLPSLYTTLVTLPVPGGLGT